jgi:hypothetical protein
MGIEVKIQIIKQPGIKSMNKQCNWRYKALAKAVAAATLLAGASTAQALSFEFGDGGEWELDWDTNVAYSAQWRVAKQDDDKFEYRDTGDFIDSSARYTLLLNANDGNNNFSRSLVQNKISFVSEMDLAWRNFGLFARGRGYYDDVYDSKTDQNEEDFLTYNSGELFGGDASFREFPDGTVDAHKDRLEMLDYFLYASGELPGDRLFDVRLGSQVINWGEATFSPGISGLQNRADLIARNTPGVEVKEILLPTGAIYAQVDLVPDVTFEAYYQYEWRKTELNGVGSFFSDRDFLGPGAQNFLVAIGDIAVISAPKLNEEKASDDGQWGAALHWVTEGGSDFGLYYVNAHNKAPAYQLNTSPIGLPESYTIKYFEDIQGYAASFTTVLGITNVQGEISYKTDVPVVLDNGDPVDGDLISVQLGGSYVLEPTMLWDDANLTFEVAAVDIDSHDSGELRYDDHAAAVYLRLELAYLNVFSGLDLKVPIFLQRGLDGNVLETAMVEDATAFNIAFKAIYLNNFTAQVGYTNYFDGGENHLITDRDNVSLNVSYSF